ncbi:hypothetical protein B0H10DRAFT_1944492 [Mycena sp. CBHHK59/15]|nr:hypothetical protein B0H10DRAFT_1944492 [Mycena sp. CBHHK59/15]
MLLTASWCNIGLYTLQLVLSRRYFQRSSRPVLHQIGVGALVVFDTLCTVGVCADVYLSVLVFPEDPDSVTLLKPLSAIIFMTYSSAMVEQAFLCHLYFVLTQNITVTAFLGLLILVHTGFSFASAVLLLTTKEVLGFSFLTTTIGAITCAATDIFIAISLGIKFWRMIQPLNKENSMRSSVRRILILTLSSGAIVASNTLIMMILLLKINPAFSFFFYCAGRVYSVTILGNFLVNTALIRAPPENASDRVGTGIVFRVEVDTTFEDPSSRVRTPARKSTTDPSVSPTTHEERIHLSLDRKQQAVAA